MTEIDREYFCSSPIGCVAHEFVEISDFERLSLKCKGKECKCYYCKWPTPQEFEQEYGRKPIGMPYWSVVGNDWCLISLWDTHIEDGAVIACTPYPKPDKDWKPE